MPIFELKVKFFKSEIVSMEIPCWLSFCFNISGTVPILETQEPKESSIFAVIVSPT